MAAPFKIYIFGKIPVTYEKATAWPLSWRKTKRLSGKLLPAPLATSLQDKTATPGLHALTETMGLLAPMVIRLISHLHLRYTSCTVLSITTRVDFTGQSTLYDRGREGVKRKNAHFIHIIHHFFPKSVDKSLSPRAPSPENLLITLSDSDKILLIFTRKASPGGPAKAGRLCKLPLSAQVIHSCGKTCA